MRFAAPALLGFALLAPIAAVVAAWLWRRRRAAEAAWMAPALASRLARPQSKRRIALSIATLSIAVLGTTLALARPRWGMTEQRIERKGIDIVFVLDSSLSMAAFDVAPSRLGAAKAILRRLATELSGNRIALLQAEGRGVTLCPLTLDAGAIDLLLDAIEPASLPTPGTELAPALDAALRLFPSGSESHRAIVLVSDGEDHGSGLDETTERLNEAGVAVFALGVGTLEGSPLPLPAGDIAGERRPAEDRFKRDRRGQVVISRLNESALEQLAQKTSGAYLRVPSAATDPKPLVDAIAKLEGRTIESLDVTTRAERFQWPLALAAAALFAHLAVRPFRRAQGSSR